MTAAMKSLEGSGLRVIAGLPSLTLTLLYFDLSHEPHKGQTRRVFLQRLTFLGGGVLLFGPACNRWGAPVPPPKKVAPAGPQQSQQSTTHHTFTNEDYLVMAAAVDRILPRDEDPGAVDANVPQYIDLVLLTPELHQMRQDFLEGLGQLEKRAQGTHGKSFPDLAPEQKDALLTEFKNAKKGSGEAQFYENLLVLTLEGFLGDPQYGGNKDKVGWALVGFGAYVPPDYKPLQPALAKLGIQSP
jgi:gluconate 2-dehydrogenase gamma chain